MGRFLGLAGLSTGALFLSSCVTTPYETAFNACEAEADRCYAICENIPDERGYVQCQSHCDSTANRCFDQAYDAYQNQNYGYGNYGYGSGYGSPWYGRYGSWYPSYGFYYDYRSYDRYGYRKKRPHPPGYGWGNRPPRGGNNNQPRPPRGGSPSGGPPSGPPPVGQPRPEPDFGKRQPRREWTPPPGNPPAPVRPNFTPPPQSAPPPSLTPPPASPPPPTPRTTPPPRSSEDRPQRPPSPRDNGEERQPN